jgi:hypothetical protein
MQWSHREHSPRKRRHKEAPPRACEFPGCDEPGPHKAPHAPDDLRNYRWFCLAHVREYNRGWNFFEGWSQGEIERFQREDLTGHRPTWPFGSRRDPDDPVGDLSEVFRAFAHDWFGTARGRRREQRVNGQRHDARRDDALAALDLEQPFTRTELKRCYITLVKRHHPDANGGSKESEERLKSINQAYTYLRDEIR